MFTERKKGHHSTGSHKPQMASEEELFNFLQTSPKEKDGIIYFHIPFCDNICSFCSMNRTKLNNELDSYADFLLCEIDKFSKTSYMKGKNIKSVYFGGGTPTILKERHLEPIIIAINNKFNISSTCEFSLETTLHNLPVSKVKLLKKLGVNRFSIGVQTFNTNGRKILNRVFNKEEAVNRLTKIRENFDDMVCIDIIYNYPRESIEDVLEDARIMKDLKIDSASFYSLMFSEGSVLSQTVSKDYYNIQTDKELHHAFLGSLLNSGEYEVLEHTKINRKNRDRYQYIRLSHIGTDILPIGLGAGGRLGEYSIYTINKEKKIVSRVNKIQKKRSQIYKLISIS